MKLDTLETNYMVRTRPVSNAKTFNVHYVKALSKQGAVNAIDPMLDSLGTDEVIIDVLEPGEEAYGMSKQDIKDLFKKK